MLRGQSTLTSLDTPSLTSGLPFPGKKHKNKTEFEQDIGEQKIIYKLDCVKHGINRDDRVLFHYRTSLL